MQLVEQGKLDLETDVNTYLDFTLPGEIMGAAGKAAPPITLTHLMAHTAGFEDVGAGLFQLSEDQMIPLTEYVRTHLPTRVFPPGELAAYSNYGTALAAYIVELVSGQPFADYVEHHIFEPLGMKRSTFRQPIPEHLADNVAFGYRYIDGEAVAAEFLYVLEAPGSLSTTASDMARFMLAHLHGGELGGERIMQEERRQCARVFRIHGQWASGFVSSRSRDSLQFSFVLVAGRRRGLVHFVQRRQLCGCKRTFPSIYGPLLP